MPGETVGIEILEEKCHILRNGWAVQIQKTRYVLDNKESKDMVFCLRWRGQIVLALRRKIGGLKEVEGERPADKINLVISQISGCQAPSV